MNLWKRFGMIFGCLAQVVATQIFLEFSSRTLGKTSIFFKGVVQPPTSSSKSFQRCFLWVMKKWRVRKWATWICAWVKTPRVLRKETIFSSDQKPSKGSRHEPTSISWNVTYRFWSIAHIKKHIPAATVAREPPTEKNAPKTPNPGRRCGWRVKGEGNFGISMVLYKSVIICNPFGNQGNKFGFLY